MSGTLVSYCFFLCLRNQVGKRRNSRGKPFRIATCLCFPKFVLLWGRGRRSRGRGRGGRRFRSGGRGRGTRYFFASFSFFFVTLQLQHDFSCGMMKEMFQTSRAASCFDDPYNLLSDCTLFLHPFCLTVILSCLVAQLCFDLGRRRGNSETFCCWSTVVFLFGFRSTQSVLVFFCQLGFLFLIKGEAGVDLEEVSFNSCEKDKFRAPSFCSSLIPFQVEAFFFQEEVEVEVEADEVEVENLLMTKWNPGWIMT